MSVLDQKPTFHVGICMAGAISAGAYTAGVMDYLFEALEHWERAKKLQNNSYAWKQGDYRKVPRHDVLIDVIGGASAGGMTAAIAAAATQIKFDPITQADEHDDARTTQNPLFNSWVNLTETDQQDMMSQMLSNSDIESNPKNSGKEVRAAFNSTFIEEIATSVLEKGVESTYERPYIASDADIFTTVTNLRGFDYQITFKTTSGDRNLKMKMHRDYAFFKFSSKNDRGTAPTVINTEGDHATTVDLPNDGRIPISFTSGNILNVDILKQAAMSTGAFPVGLESRDLIRSRAYIKNNKYLNLMLSVKDTSGASYELVPQDESFHTLNVDGGVINNEPFEITQSLLDDRRRSKLHANGASGDYTVKTSAAEFDSTVVMIDPFPNDEGLEDGFVSKKALRNLVPSIISAMRGQLMLKDEQIKRAYLSDDYTRFLIMPVRSAMGESENSKNEARLFPIACGSLGGFGGFFSKKFRTHDYFLGRRNCQKFLQEHFSAPANADNPILRFGYEDDEYTIVTKNTDGVANTYLPLIPDVRVHGDEQSGFWLAKPLKEERYAYPKIKLSYLLSLKPKIQDRVKCILNNIEHVSKVDKLPKEILKSKILPRINKESKFDNLFNQGKKRAVHLYLGIGKYFAKSYIAKNCINTIVEEMEKRNLVDVDC
ncbi:patatin-like phospholipase family protein [Dyadobacter sp. CY351]|uniref:patatin-like phospholipase family protein n=1 Tax=Dyadobacter sp. CY351 TaxID=2909337 RepID=UPI001F422123|nr:patatin-like phospholipase family protein [Dyadobacter sp. CY351]MCF2518542.1 patatin-like phospholipase family protein [Dyadobacter sp. CY351]